MNLTHRFLAALIRRIYRIRVLGAENLPATGPALLLVNHLSLIDGFLIGVCVPRPVRFLIWRPYYEDWRVHWLFKSANAIPISDQDSPKEILKSLAVAREALKAGEIVCLFAEGQISRTGNLQEFKRGFERLVKDTDVPVVPIHLDRVWGSIFSFEHGKVLFKTPHTIPYPVTVSIGKPMPPTSSAFDVRQAVLDLSVDAFKMRMIGLEPLSAEFLRRAGQQPRVLAVADSSGLELSYGRLAAVAHVLSKRLATILPAQENVGILLPSSVGGVVANLAVSLLGKVPVNLNYTIGAKTLDICIAKARIEKIITSRKLLDKTKLPELPSMIFIEDMVKSLPKAQIIWARILVSLFPGHVLARRWSGEYGRTRDANATVLFSSGSTGIPKGVVLSHENVLANLLALSQAFDISKDDRMIGILPFFHCFGFTATMWFPLISGFSGVYHVNPLDAKIVGELAGKYKATLLLATPTFLSAYTRKCSPEEFSHLRYVITGAEKLRDTVGKAFIEKFGKTPLEGYGCTELSPVATVSLPNVTIGKIHQVGYKPGKIGQPIPGVSVRVVDPETYAAVAPGDKGLLLVKGLNVMKGYLDEPQKTADVIRDGWYVTGDMARIDADGFVELVDRLSRFSKIGGEMVPHMLIEEKLQELSGQSEPVFAVTAVPDEKRGEQLAVLYSEAAGLKIDELYAKLRASGLPNLWVPAKENFFPVPTLPYLGTGKLDLAALKSIAVEKTTQRP